MWRILEAGYRSWAGYYGLALALAVLVAAICGWLIGLPTSVVVLLATAMTLGLWWVIGTIRRAIDRREGREALYLKTPVPIGTIARVRVTENPLPLAAATGLGLLAMVPATLWGGGVEAGPWHVAAVGAALLAFDQLTLFLEEIQLHFNGAGRIWFGRAVTLGIVVSSAAAGAAIGSRAARGEGILAPFRDVNPIVILGLLGLAGLFTLLAYLVFLRREYPVLKV